MDEKISVLINGCNEPKLFDLTIQIKGLSKAYFLVLEDVLNKHLQTQERGKDLAQQSEFWVTNEPLFILKDALLKEINLKIDSKWKQI